MVSPLWNPPTYVTIPQYIFYKKEHASLEINFCYVFFMIFKSILSKDMDTEDIDFSTKL